MGTCGILDALFFLLLGATSQTCALTCYRGLSVRFGNNLAEEVALWTTSGTLRCSAGEVCQETLLLIDVGHTSFLVGSKGCSRTVRGEFKDISIYTRAPGMVVASYTRSCSSDLCNESKSSSVLLTALPLPVYIPPGEIYCPVCLLLSRSCFFSSSYINCKLGTTHCYSGDIVLNGGGLSTTFGIQGCMASNSSTILTNNTIGIFSAKEKVYGTRNSLWELPLDESAHIFLPAWTLGLGLSLALCPLC